MSDSLKSMKFATSSDSNASAPPFTPYYDRVLLRKIETAGDSSAASAPSYALTANMQAVDRPRLFEVVAVGPGRAMEFEPKPRTRTEQVTFSSIPVDNPHCLVPLLSSPGDRVYVGKHAGAGNEIKIAGVEYLVVKEEEILGREAK